MTENANLVAYLTSAYGNEYEEFRSLLAHLIADIPMPHRPNALLELGNLCWRETAKAHPAVDVWEYASQLFASMASDLGVAKCSANLAMAYQQNGAEAKAFSF